MSSHPSIQNRPYQGYPYVNPIVIDAPSIDAATAAKWQNLPRKQVTPTGPDSGGESSRGITNATNKSQDSQSEKSEEIPVIYIDIPDDSDTPQRGEENTNQRKKKDSNAEPVVYIELPETNTEETGREQSNPAYVEETIFYDPFEDRRIDVRSEGSTSRDGDTSPERPIRPALPGYSAEGTSRDRSPQHDVIPPFMSKETYIYSQTQDDGLRLSPLPVPEYPDPPPAYTEVDRPREPELPRTQVIVPERSQAASSNPNRKQMLCPYCGTRVLTLVIRQNGILTHVLGLIFLLTFFPLAICIYCTSCCKYRNHYCPQCNHLIGYEIPLLCQNMVYNKV